MILEVIREAEEHLIQWKGRDEEVFQTYDWTRWTWIYARYFLREWFTVNLHGCCHLCALLLSRLHYNMVCFHSIKSSSGRLYAFQSGLSWSNIASATTTRCISFSGSTGSTNRVMRMKVLEQWRIGDISLEKCKATPAQFRSVSFIHWFSDLHNSIKDLNGWFTHQSLSIEWETLPFL